MSPLATCKVLFSYLGASTAMQSLTPVVRERLMSMHLPEAEIVNAIEWMERGESLGKAFLAISRLFQRTPQLNHSTR